VPILEVLIIAVGLAMDAFAVALGTGASGYIRDRRAAFRVSFHFGLFQFLMPVIGWLLAKSVQSHIESVDHWLAFLLLTFIGGRMILEGRGPVQRSYLGDPSRGISLVALSLATSIDALAVGLSLAFLGTDIWWPSIAIGIVTGSLSLVGVRMGNKLGEYLGKHMEIAGGLILLAIGGHMLITHLTS
jgi:manganese efflux pump family protein